MGSLSMIFLSTVLLDVSPNKIRLFSEQNPIMLCDFVLTDFCIKCHPGMLPKLLTPVFDSVFQFGCGPVFDPLMSGIARGFDKDKGVEESIIDGSLRTVLFHRPPVGAAPIFHLPSAPRDRGQSQLQSEPTRGAATSVCCSPSVTIT